jgi:hypothetical protein
MSWPFYNKALANYWLKAFGLYALTEACIQLLFNFVLNNFQASPISNIEFHGIMWLFQCLLIWPIWSVAQSVYHRKVITQVFVNLAFFLLYSYVWFYIVQDIIQSLHHILQEKTRAASDRLPTPVDNPSNLDYQILKHGFRLSWFFLANYFYHYRDEEQKRRVLAVANRELELRLLTWHLNPSFYFQAIGFLQKRAAIKPSNCTQPILQLAKVMEYVIYETKERTIDVAKEIYFLNSYIDLLNQQEDREARFTLICTGRFDKLKIAPLLLVGFIDKLVAKPRPGQNYHLELGFSEARMTFTIISPGDDDKQFLVRHDDQLYRRIIEIYDDRFRLDQLTEDKTLELELFLDEHT